MSFNYNFNRPWLVKMSKKSDGYGLGTIVFIIALAILALVLIYRWLNKNKNVTPDKQGIYHAQLVSPEKNIDVQAEKFGTVALTIIVMLICVVGLIVLSIFDLKNTMPIYFVGAMFLLSGCKLCLIDIKKIKELISLI